MIPFRSLFCHISSYLILHTVVLIFITLRVSSYCVTVELYSLGSVLYPRHSPACSEGEEAAYLGNSRARKPADSSVVAASPQEAACSVLSNNNR